MSTSLQLYRRILRLHRKKLPYDMRMIGDSYVKKEFRDHKSAKPEFLKQFVDEWTKYATMLEVGTVGKDLDENTVSSMSRDQKVSLVRLRQETNNFNPE